MTLQYLDAKSFLSNSVLLDLEIKNGGSNMAGNVEAQLKQLDEEMKKAKTQTEKDAIKERQAELKRQLEGAKKK